MRPPIFSDLELEAARARAVAEAKLLIVDATAVWCGPCQLMDRTTWVDPAVVAWVQEYAIAIQIDVDAEKEAARGLRIEAMPTIIVFVEGKEFDRVVGAKKPKELLAWLDGVTRGETSLVATRRQVQGEPADMSARMTLARELVRIGRYDEATVEHVWLWDHMLEHEPAMVGVRTSFFARDLAQLARLHAPARTAIEQLRDRVAPSATGVIDAAAFRDWKCLNAVLGENARSLAWYHGLSATARTALGPVLERDIVPLLLEAGRWSDAGALYEQPLAILERAAAGLTLSTENIPAEHVAEMREVHRRMFRDSTARLVRALSAAGRADDVAVIVQRARQQDPSKEMRPALASARAPFKWVADRMSARARRRRPSSA